MSRRARVGLVLLASACAAPAPTPSAPDPEPRQAVVNAAPPAAAPPLAESAAPPPAPTLPDGTVILPCEAPPAGMACIPGGPFVRGADDGPENARPASTVHLQTFYMDVDEATNADYKACKQRGECLRGGPLYNDFSRPRQPIVGVSWYAAETFCRVHGKTLPTEAQWEKAARGPDGALHPWGDAPSTCERAIIEDASGRSCGVKKRKEHPEKGRTFEVGSRPAGVYGLRDMMGNAWEWVYDWASTDYAACGEACAGVDPKGPCAGAEPCEGHDQRIVRGGSWYWPAEYATGLHRRTHFPINEISDFHHFGFRCAATVEQARRLQTSSPPTTAGPEVDPGQ